MIPDDGSTGRSAGQARWERLVGKERILVVGCSGSGKSTLARELGPSLGLPVVHLDRDFWNPGWVETPFEEWEAKLDILLTEPAWIMDGTYDRTLDVRLRFADAVIFLDLPPWLCRLRILKRIALSFGRTRPDLADHCPEQVDREFLRWAWAWHREILPNVERSLAAAGDRVAVIRLSAAREVEQLRAHLRPGAD